MDNNDIGPLIKCVEKDGIKRLEYPYNSLKPSSAKCAFHFPGYRILAAEERVQAGDIPVATKPCEFVRRLFARIKTKDRLIDPRGLIGEEQFAAKIAQIISPVTAVKLYYTPEQYDGRPQVDLIGGLYSRLLGQSVLGYTMHDAEMALESCMVVYRPWESADYSECEYDDAFRGKNKITITENSSHWKIATRIGCEKYIIDQLGALPWNTPTKSLKKLPAIKSDSLPLP